MLENKYNALSRAIIGGCIDVHRELGPGLLESVYEECLTFELKSRGLYVDRQCELPIVYKDQVLAKTFIMDIVVNELIVLELKAVQTLLPIHEVQLMTYLRMARYKLGLLVNFNVELMRDGIVRKINGYL